MFKPCILDINNLNYSIGNLNIINNFSLKLHLRDIIVLLGASGCGKTSILNAIAGLNEPSFNKFIMQKISLAYIFQEPNLIPFYTAFDNIKLANNNISDKEIYKILDLLNLNKNDALKYPSELSGGMKTRINFARAILKNPTLLLLDEPFNGINYELKDFLIDFLINFIKTKNKSAIMVTHDRYEALKVADYIYFLGKNSSIKKIIKLDTPQNKRNDDFYKKYLNNFEVYYE